MVCFCRFHTDEDVVQFDVWRFRRYCATQCGHIVCWMQWLRWCRCRSRVAVESIRIVIVGGQWINHNVKYCFRRLLHDAENQNGKRKSQSTLVGCVILDLIGRCAVKSRSVSKTMIQTKLTLKIRLDVVAFECTPTASRAQWGPILLVVRNRRGNSVPMTETASSLLINCTRIADRMSNRVLLELPAVPVGAGNFSLMNRGPRMGGAAFG